MMTSLAPSGVIDWRPNRDRPERTGICLLMFVGGAQKQSYGKYFYCISTLTHHKNNADIPFRHGVILEGSPSWIDDLTRV